MTKEEVLKKYFGYDSFRAGQEILVNGILSGRDTLGIMPTGAGKSLCYQIPALLMPGITLVISPLISLMKDQVTALNQAGIHAAYLNSSLTQGQYQTALRNLIQGRQHQKDPETCECAEKYHDPDVRSSHEEHPECTGRERERRVHKAESDQEDADQ